MRVTHALAGCLFLLCSTAAAAQAPALFQLSADSVHAAADGSRPVQLEDTRWRFRSGDQPGWSAPELDDSRWTLVSPEEPELDVVEDALRDAGERERAGSPAIGWFRVRIRVDPALVGVPLALRLVPHAATEVYLDGRRVVTTGEVERRPGADTPIARPHLPVLVEFQRPEAVLAVRLNLASLGGIVDRLTGDPDFFHLSVAPASALEGMARADRSLAALSAGVAGLLFALGLLHLLLFSFLRRPINNLYFAAFAGLIGLYFATSYFSAGARDYRVLLDLHRLGMSAAALSMAALVGFLHTTFLGRLRRGFWLVLAAAVAQVGIYSFLLGRARRYEIVMVLFLVPVLEGVRVIATAVWRRRDGAWLIGAGVVAMLLCVAYQSMFALLGLPNPGNLLVFGFVVISLTSSVYLARNFARTSRGFERLSRELEESNRELERRVAERTAELTASEQKFRSVVEGANDAILLLAADTTAILEANPAAERLLGRDCEQLRRMRMAELCPQESRERCRALFQEHLSSGLPIREELFLLDAEGGRITVEISASTATVAGERVVQVMVHDLTERKRMELAQEEARRAAEEANRTKSQFLANMSHELRTPLNAILGFSEMLIEEAGDMSGEECVPDLEKIHAAGKHLLWLINDILDISKVEAGKAELYLESCAVEPLLRETADTVRPLIDRQGNAFELRLGEELGDMLMDTVKLRQILLNLLSNASKFTEHGTVSLTAQRTRDADGGEWLVFEVSDSGIGMSEEQIARLFQPFVQVDASAARKYGGTGLGLTISKRFTEMMGGTLSVRSEPGVGTTFVARLPTRVAELTRAVPLAPDVAARLGGAGDPSAEADAPSRGTVVVIDDDEGARDVVRRTLTREGYRVLEAANGPAGLELVRRERPDVITLDVLLPGQDGWATLAALKADEALRQIPVVMMTMVDDRNLGFALGAADYLVKPVEREQLLQVVHRHVGHGRGASILVVEDDGATREMLVRTLEREGWAVRQAANGREALDLLDHGPLDLILLDLVMPEMNGFEFLEALRAAGRTVPVVVVTSMDLSAEERDRLRGGVERILQKGCHPREELVQEVKRLLQRIGGAEAIGV